MLFNKLKKYNELPLIKADTGEKLYTYWENLYKEDNPEIMDKRFEANIKNLKKSIKLLTLSNVFFTNSYVLSMIMVKIEVYLTHCLVLCNLSSNTELKNEFNKINLQKNKFTKAIFYKILKNA